MASNHGTQDIIIAGGGCTRWSSKQFDKATFANAPLELTGEKTPPVSIRAGAGDDYQVGSGPIWRVGKKMLGLAVLMHFRAGRPFHAGTSWKLMQPGLEGMKALFAD